MTCTDLALNVQNSPSYTFCYGQDFQIHNSAKNAPFLGAINVCV